METTQGVTRRVFIKRSAATAGGLVVAFMVPGGKRALAQGASKPWVPNAFLRIGTDDTVTVLLAHSEMGQGIWTTLPMLIAEELDADWKTIRVEHAPVAPVYNHTVFGAQITGGSTTTWTEFDRYRQAGAAARELLARAAAERFGVDRSGIRTQNGQAIAGDRRARYGELADAASRLKPIDLSSVTLRDRKDWKVIGKPTRRLDTPEKITGGARFGMDVQLDGLLTATVARSPVFGGKVKSFDATAAESIPGVRKVVQVPTGIAVVADDFWAAKLGRDALKVEWEPGDGAGLDSKALREEFGEMARSEGAPAAQGGDVVAALAGAATRIEADYAVPYLAHAPMEPGNCTVRIGPDSCEIWAGTQFQTMDQGRAAAITGLKPDRIKVNTTFLGGGFGRRATPDSDFVSEAVHVAMAAGAPVKTVWTRDDDVRGGYYRPLFVHRARIGLDADGKPVAWHHVLAGQSIMQGTPFEGAIQNGVDPTSVEGMADSPYLREIPDHLVSLHSPKTTIRVLWWRSVGHTHTAFVMESLIDEAAHAAGVDPVDYRRSLLESHKRHLGVLNLAAEKAGWGSPLPSGRARGVAVHESFGSFIAQVAEVSVDRGRIRVHRVVCAVDCGTVVNPEAVAAQMEGGVVFGLGAVLHQKLDIERGEVLQSNFHDYRMVRMNEAPAVEVHIVPSTERPGGIGEPGVPPIAPAVANAVFTLTGKRLRELPLDLAS